MVEGAGKLYASRSGHGVSILAWESETGPALITQVSEFAGGNLTRRSQL